jgi:RNA polymerase sigma-70 factor (ECF subfamily)
VVDQGTPEIESGAAGAEAAAQADAAAQAEAAAFARVIEANHDDLTRVAFVVSLDIETARQAVPVAWAKVWRDRMTPRSPEGLRPWLLAVAATEARSPGGLGARGREIGVAGDTGLPASRAAAEPAYPAEELRLARTLAQLDSRDRTIVGLRYVGGLTEAQLSSELGMPEGAVRARLARVIGVLLRDAPGEASDTIDAHELRLMERITKFGDRALAPFDAGEVAKAAIEAAPPPPFAERLAGVLEPVRNMDRRVWLGAAGVLMAVVVIGALWRGGGSGVAIATPIPTDASRLCELSELELKVTSWQGEPAHRSAAVEMRNISRGACLVDSAPEPWLVDGAHIALVMGQDQPSQQMRIGPGDVLRTTVAVRNYCGVAPPPPVTVAFRQGETILFAAPLGYNDMSGLPTCGGTPPSTGDIGMRAWAP